MDLNFSLHEFYLLLIAVIIGIITGVEREFRNKSAGLRTLMMVSLGSCIFTILSIKIGVISYDRIAANIVTGIGFLGAGVIFKDENRISGLTTAATIWLTASLGMCVGAGYVALAFIGCFLVLVILWLLVLLEKIIEKASTIRDYKITCLNSTEKYNHYEKIFKEHKLSFSRLSQFKTKDSWTGHWKLGGPEKRHEKLRKILLKDQNIETLEF